MLVRLVCFILLVSCAPSDRLQRTYAPTTGVWQVVSRDTEVFRDGRDHVLARAIILEGGGEAGYYLSLSFLHGKGNNPKAVSVAMNGVPMPYVMDDRLSTCCNDHCHKTEVGHIQLTKTQFRTAGNEGMTLVVDGLRRDYLAVVPARLFYTALGGAHLLAPVSPPPTD